MTQLWEVVGGAASGGILVREGKEISSAKTAERLSTGALVKELTLDGERLNFELLTGSGPSTGWVGVTLNGKPLVIKSTKAPPVAAATAPAGGYAVVDAPVAAVPAPAAPMEAPAEEEKKPALLIDEALKAKVTNAAKEYGSKAFDDWCFKYKVMKFPVANCRFRVFCFHNAGSAESIWTGPANNGILSWVKAQKDVELVAMSYPGRDKLLKSAPHESTESLIEAMLPVLHDKLADGVPYGVVSHSVGTWVLFELLMQARKAGLPMPKVAFFSAFPGPQIPSSQRPWRINRKIDEAEMKKEVLNWDKTHFEGAAKVVFNNNDWDKTWSPLMRADFRLFDEYVFRHEDVPKFDFPIYTFHMGKEYFLEPEMLQLWKDWTTSDFVFETFEDFGHLTCVYLPAQKKVYTEKIAEILNKFASSS